jgi:ketosteroid isomerase-like protein
MRKLLALALLFLAVVPALAKDDEAQIKAAIADGYKQWVAAANKKDAVALANLYDADAVLMPPREEAVVGHDAILAWFQRYVGDPRLVPFTDVFTSFSFHVVGDIAIDTSDFDGDATRDGQPIHFHGKNIVLWKKQKDGSWKIYRDMWDEIPPKRN